MSDWYISNEGREEGPFALKAALAHLHELDPTRVRVWREGFSEWAPVSDVAEFAGLFPPPAMASGAVDEASGIAAEPPQAGAARDGKARVRNVFARHWRGELPLWVSYWIFGFLVNVVILGLSAVVAELLNVNEEFQPRSIFYTSAAIWGSVLLVVVWQVVGVWRSATQYAHARSKLGKKAVWGGMAKAAMVLGVLRLAVSIATQALPQLTEMYRIAFQGDPDVPPYFIRVMRNGTEAEVVGGFKYGLTNDLAVIVKANPQMKLVHLDSVGGRVGEGQSMFELIRERGLSTYVSSKCLSSCTLAFAGGRERFLLKGAILGFHRGSFPGIAEAHEIDAVQRHVFTRAGFDARFVDRALSTPSDDIWQPDSGLLTTANVVTSVTDGRTFAASGYGAHPSKESIAAELTRAIPLYRTMQERFPADFAGLVDDCLDKVLKGSTKQEMIDGVRAALIPFIARHIPEADDDVLMDYDALIVDQYTLLAGNNPTACYEYASGTGATTNYAAEFPQELLRRELDLEDRVLRTAAARPPAGHADVLLAKLRKSLVTKGVTDADLKLLESSAVEKPKHGRYCRTAIAFYREVTGLPTQEAASVLRTILSSR